MNREFRFDRNKISQARWALFRQALPVALGLFGHVSILAITEPERFSIGSIIAFTVCYSTFITWVVILWYRRTLNASVFVTDSEIKFNSGLLDVRITCSEISRIEKDAHGSLLIYTVTSQTKAAAVINYFLEGLNDLESYLSTFVQVTPLRKVPFLLSLNGRFIFLFSFFFFLPLNMFSFIPVLSVLSFAGTTFPLGIIIYRYIKFRKEYDSLGPLFLYLFLFSALCFVTYHALFHPAI